ncbi:MAG: L,D-transpeptidase family protein [Desulfomonilaceae bacterium]
MHTRVFSIVFILGLLLIAAELKIPVISAMPVEDPAPSVQDQSTDQPAPVPTTSSPASLDAQPRPVDSPACLAEAPDDPCLPPLYKNWREMSLHNQENAYYHEFSRFRIHIDRSNFELIFEGIHRDESVEEIYRTHVGLGDTESPTPEGRFLINHVYCYPDVVLFDASGEPVPGVYDGFFAPLLLCDEQGRCERHRELGMHGYNHPGGSDPQVTLASTYGAISAGCIRLPDPCRFKASLIRLVGIGPMKRNDRGSYHWLNKPVEVVIDGDYPGGEDQLTLLSLIREGAVQVQEGLKNVLDIFYR